MLIHIYKNSELSKIFGVGMVKNGFAQSGHGALKLTVFQKHAGSNSGKLKVDWMILGLAWLKMAMGF